MSTDAAPVDREMPPAAVVHPTRDLGPTAENPQLVDLVQLTLPDPEAEFEDEPRYILGPGVVESFFWMIGCHAAQMAAFLIFLMAFVAVGIFQEGARTSLKTFLNEDVLRSFTFIAASSLGGMLLIVPAVRLRLWGAAPELKRPGWLQIALIFSLLFPLAVVSTAIYNAVEPFWKDFVANAPEEFRGPLKIIDEMNSIELVNQQLQGTNPLLLVLAIAFAPAFAEEYIFRGLIGRGLIARYGVTFGVVVSSGLFAMAHVFPPHAAATFVMGLVLHTTYRATRNLSVPILLHFLNNAIAVLINSPEDENAEDAAGFRSYALLVGCTIWLVTALWLLHRLRLRESPTTIATPEFPETIILTKVGLA